MKIKLLLLLFVVIYSSIYPQQAVFKIRNNKSSNAVLFSLQGENNSYVDSIKSDDGETFTYLFNEKKNHPGIYRLSLNKNLFLDFVYDGEEISIETDAGNIADSIIIKKSLSNQLYYSFIRLNKAFKTKTELLNLILLHYPKDDDYYKITSEKLIQIKKEYFDFVKNVSAEKPNSFISGYINTSQLSIAFLNNTYTPDEQLHYLKLHALDHVDFNDASLIYSDAFTNKAIEFLTYYRSPQLQKQQLQKEFMTAVDSLLKRAKLHQLVYQHIVDYLISGFKKYGFDEVVDYIVENYVIKDDLCLDDKTEGMIQKRILQAKNLKTGNVIPDLTLPDQDGKLIDLKKINSEKVLLVFYSTSCPHCKLLLPKMGKVYPRLKAKGIEVMAVSLDSSKTDWIDFIKNNSLNWINVSDLKGWDSKAVSGFYLYATPTIFLIDSERKIIDTPLTIEEIDKLL